VVSVPLATSAPLVDALWLPAVLVVETAASAADAAFTASTLTVSALTPANGAMAIAVSEPAAESEAVPARFATASAERTPLAVRAEVVAMDAESRMTKPPATASDAVPAR
jgi:hypothetical protein